MRLVRRLRIGDSGNEVQRRFQIPAKSQKAIDAGSVGPWDPGGISEFQKAAGEALGG